MKASLKEIQNVSCPDCGAPPSNHCIKADGTIKMRPHKHRVNVAERELRERARKGTK